MPDPYRTRKLVGLALFLVAQLVGGGIVLLLDVVLPLFMEDAARTFAAMGVGAIIAFPAMAMYLTLPRLLDRYDPEPVYALLLALSWGALGAIGFASLINEIVGGIAGAIAGPEVGHAVMAVCCAPFVEESLKGMMIVGIFYFLRNEFDGVVDGIIYGTFIAIGFAATENVIYYARALHEHDAATLGFTVIIRGVLSPWGHPLYTSMTGIGIGLAREAERKWVRYVAPFVGFGFAVMLHAIWNGALALTGPIALLLLPLWFLFVASFIVLVIWLVRRRGRSIREMLTDEVAMGNLTAAEVDVTVSIFGGIRAFLRGGRKASELMRAIARLGIDKGHVARAMRGNNSTVSMDFIVPLRAKIRELKSAGVAIA